MMNSTFRQLGSVEFPPFMGRQFYMHEFDLAAPVMPTGFEDYAAPVAKLCVEAGATEGTAYMTVDEKIIQPGGSQRRPGPHVDGCFIPDMNRWGHGGGWNHTCNNIPVPRMAVIVAASAVGCRAWEGEFDASPKEDGDMGHVELDEGVVLPANVGFLLSSDCIHESLPMEEETARSFLRIALPVGVQ